MATDWRPGMTSRPWRGGGCSHQQEGVQLLSYFWCISSTKQHRANYFTQCPPLLSPLPVTLDLCPHLGNDLLPQPPPPSPLFVLSFLVFPLSSSVPAIHPACPALFPHRKGPHTIHFLNPLIWLPSLQLNASLPPPVLPHLPCLLNSVVDISLPSFHLQWSTNILSLAHQPPPPKGTSIQEPASPPSPSLHQLVSAGSDALVLSSACYWQMTACTQDGNS